MERQADGERMVELTSPERHNLFHQATATGLHWRSALFKLELQPSSAGISLGAKYLQPLR